MYKITASAAQLVNCILLHAYSRTTTAAASSFQLEAAATSSSFQLHENK